MGSEKKKSKTMGTIADWLGYTSVAGAGTSAGLGVLSAIEGGFDFSLFGHRFKKEANPIKAGNYQIAGGISGAIGGATGLASSAMKFQQSGSSAKNNRGLSGLLGMLGGGMSIFSGIANMIGGKAAKKGKEGAKTVAKAKATGGLFSLLGGGAGIAKGLVDLADPNASASDRKKAITSTVFSGLGTLVGLVGMGKGLWDLRKLKKAEKEAKKKSVLQGGEAETKKKIDEIKKINAENQNAEEANGAGELNQVAIPDSVEGVGNAS